VTWLARIEWKGIYMHKLEMEGPSSMFDFFRNLIAPMKDINVKSNGNSRLT
jgi:hypothetical protein